VERVAAREAKVALPSALLADGLPLLVRGQLKFGTEVNVDALLDGIATLAESMRSGPVKQGPTDLRGLRKLRLELSAAAPAVTMGGQRLTNLQVPQIVFDGLKLGIPLANAEAYDGQLILRQAAYDVGVTPLRHSQKIVISGVDLHKVTSDPAKPVGKDSYQVFGKLSGSGALAGAGFAGADRRSWQGEFKIDLNDLVAQRGDGKPREVGFFSKKTAMGVLGGFLGGQAARSIALYNDDFGLFLSRMAFEPCTINVAIQRGRAAIPQGLLVGTGQNVGLQLGFMGHIDLPTETFTPGFSVWPHSLPAATQKHMRMDELTEDERAQIEKEFRAGKYHIVLTGPVAKPNANTNEFAMSFLGVIDRIDRMIAARQQQAAPGQEPAQDPAPKKKENNPFGIPLPF